MTTRRGFLGALAALAVWRKVPKPEPITLDCDPTWTASGGSIKAHSAVIYDPTAPGMDAEWDDDEWDEDTAPRMSLADIEKMHPNTAFKFVLFTSDRDAHG